MADSGSVSQVECDCYVGGNRADRGMSATVPLPPLARHPPVSFSYGADRLLLRVLRSTRTEDGPPRAATELVRWNGSRPRSAVCRPLLRPRGRGQPRGYV